MMKDGATGKVFVTAPVTFWMFLLVSNGIVNSLPGYASTITGVKSDPVQETEVIASVSNPESALDISPKTDTITNVTSVAQLTSNTRETPANSHQNTEGITSSTTLAENPVESSPDLPILDNLTSVSDLSSLEGEIESNQSISQVTNVTQLRDVSPGDWAYEALRSLVERYGCIAGYPDGTYRGNRAMTRYEFAAGLNACLQQIERIIQTGDKGTVSSSDLATLQRLIDEFKTELASLGSQVDKLEGRVSFLEDNQFSTTTKLSGLVWMNITGANASDNVRVEAINASSPDVRFAGRGADGKPLVQKVDNPNITMSTLTWLTLNTSFTGKDLLVTQLAAGNAISPANQFASAGLFNSFGTPFLDQTAGPNNGSTEVVIHDLFYQFPVGDRVKLVVGPRVNWHRFFDDNAFTFFLTGGSSFNSNGTTVYDPIDRGSGVVALVNLSEKLQLNVGYLGENNEFLPAAFGFNTSSNPSKGLFSGTNVATAELTYKPTPRANIRLSYSHITLDNNGGVVSGEPIYGVADDSFGGRIKPADVNAFGLNFDWLIASKFGIFGRYGYATTNIDPSTPGRSGGDINSQSIQFGLGFRDLGKEGALATVSFLIPFDILKGRKFLVAGGGDGGTQYEIEATYYYPLTNNIAIVPAFYLIANPNNFDSNPTIYVGNLRAQFSF